MEDTIRTKQYLEELNAIKVDSKIRINIDHLPSKIILFTRDYYKKRNNKICYVDKNFKTIIADTSKIRKGKYCNIYSTGDNDWNPVVSRGMWYKLTKEYQQELINNYNE
jgi:hypothetical protein